MRRILLTLAILIFTTQTAFAVNYPHTGYCTGNYVRLRDNPGTEDTEVLEGRLFDGNLVILLDEVFVDGDKWYEIDYPFGEGTAWIFGKYIEIYEGEIANLISSKNGFKMFERINKFTLITKPFEVGVELSAKQEIMRFRINEIYKKQIEAMFVEED